MMKKVLLLALVITSYVFVSAQTIDKPIKYQYYPSADKYTPKQGSFSKSGGAVNGWYSPEDFIRNNSSGPFTNFINLVFPDSNVVNINQNNESNNVFAHAFGHMFDLRHENWAAVPSDPNAPIQPFAQKDGYTWDSVAFRYLYRRNYSDANVVDTCFVTYYKNSGNPQNQIRFASIIFTVESDTMLYCNPDGLDLNALAGTNYFKRDTILLTADDTTSLNSGGWTTNFIIRPVNTQIQGSQTANQRNNVFGYTVTFRPGHPWSPGDTVESRGFTKPDNGVNYFGYRFVSLDNFPATLRSRQYADNSVLLFNITRYGQTTSNGWSGFMPGAVFNDYTECLAHVSGTSTVSVKEVEDLGLSLGKIYPNPAKGGQSVFFEYAVKNATNVTLEVYDMMGKKVATVLDNARVEAGEHKADATLNLNPGVYFYTLSSGNTNVSSKKFTVIR